MGEERGGCSGAHSSPEQYTGLPATPPHKGGCLATGTYRPMAAGLGPAAPDGCTAGPHSRAIDPRQLATRRGQPPAQPRRPSQEEKEAERSWEPLLLARASAGKSHPPRAPARGRAALHAARATPREPLWGGPTLALPTTFLFHTLAASAHVVSGKQPSKLSAHHP